MNPTLSQQNMTFISSEEAARKRQEAESRRMSRYNTQPTFFNLKQYPKKPAELTYNNQFSGLFYFILF